MLSITSSIFVGFEWGIRIAKLNIIWFCSCIAGLLIFSFFPSTVAAFSVADEWAKGNTEVSIRKTFKESFKSHYGRAQVIGFLLSFGFLIIYIDIQVFKALDHLWLKNSLLLLLFILLLLLVVISIYIFPLMVTFGSNLKELVKTSFYYGFSSFFWTFINLLGVVAIATVTYKYPVSIVFLSSAGMMLWLTCLTHIARKNIERKYEQLHGIIECQKPSSKIVQG